MNERVFHDTILIERLFPATPADVFAVLADVEARQRWGKPSDDTALVYDRADFRVGGTDVGHCGPQGNLIYRIETSYHDIVPDHRIVSTEAVHENAKPLSVALLSVVLEPAGGGTKLTFTAQITAFGSEAMIAGNRAGFTAAFGRLASEFQHLSTGEEP